MSGDLKPKGKGGENLLALIGTLASVGGKLAFGPEFDGDLGAPFKAGAQMLRDNREQDNLLQLLKTTPHTAPLADHIPAIIDAGGIVNNHDLLDHPEVQQTLSPSSVPQVASGIMPGEQGGLPQQPILQVPGIPQDNGLLTAIQSKQAPVDYTSPEFLSKAAALRPDIAEKIVLAQASKDPQSDLLKNILLGQKISNFETPEEKRQARMDDRQTQMMMMDKLLSSRQEANQVRGQVLQKAKITSKEEESLNTIDELRNNYRNILVDFKAGIKPSATKSVISNLLPGGDRLMQEFDPKFALLKKNTDLTQALFQKSISGVTIPEQEAKRLRPTQPQASDNPEVFRVALENNIKKANELYFIKALNIAQRGGEDIYNFVDPQTLQKYKAVRAAMNHDLSAALKNPTVMKLRQELGIDYGADNVGK